MEIYLFYFLKVIALQTIFFGLYWVINRKSNSFHFNRYFLISALILPFFIPLLNIPFSLFQTKMSTEGFLDPWLFIEQSLPIVTITGCQTDTTGIAWWLIMLAFIYLLVVIPSSFKLIYDYKRIHQLGKTSSKKEFTPLGFKLLYVPSKILSFSFLNRIFLSNQYPLKLHEKKAIITHEEYHLVQRHSLDIILAEIVRIICWFNPVVLLIQKNLKETHEYLADRHTIKSSGKNDYAKLLRTFKWQEINMMLGSGYSSASIKKRINMMERQNKKTATMKVLSLLSISLFTALIFACENNLDSFENKDETFQFEFSEADLTEEINRMMLQLENAPKDLIDRYVEEQKKHPEYRYMPGVMAITENHSDDFIEIFKKGRKIVHITEMEVDYFRVLDEHETNEHYKDHMNAKLKITGSFAFIHKVDRLKYMEYMFKVNHEDASIHDDYDKPAQLTGGMPALTQHLKENLRYPEVAREKGIEDKLTMRFVITKHGGLVYLNIEKEPETGDEEVSIEFQKAAFQALRATEGKWEPAEKDGRYVMSRMTLPIEFKLDK